MHATSVVDVTEQISLSHEMHDRALACAGHVRAQLKDEGRLSVLRERACMLSESVHVRKCDGCPESRSHKMVILCKSWSELFSDVMCV
jgi:hypothetical protein